MDALYQLSYSGTIRIISYKLKITYINAKILPMRISVNKKKIAFFISIGIIACISTMVTLIVLTNIYPKDGTSNNSETLASQDTTNASVENPVGENVPEGDNSQTPSPEDEAPAPKTISGYYIEVNRKQNVVMVYATYDDGERDLYKTFVASVGRPDSETIVGTFNITNRHEALYLVGDVWGRYAVRIDGRYYFHSVPYFSKGGSNWDDLEYLEYNKLGEPASAGCVRLAVIDAKWIYDNIPTGTTVKIYDADTLPDGVVKPTPIKIDEDSPNRGWDPTDPNPTNPWS